MNAATSGQMLLAFWRQRDREHPWGRRCLIALALAGLGLSLYFTPGARPALLAGAAVLVLASLWTAIAGSLLLQNHPHVARFVPGHVRQMRELALASWAVLSLACAGLLWQFVPLMPSPQALLLLSAASLAFMAWAARAWTLWLIVSFAPVIVFGTGLGRRLAPLWTAARDLWAAQTLPVLALGLLALAWSIARLFGNGDAAHRVVYERCARMRRASNEAMTGKQSGAGAFGRPGTWLARPFEAAAAAWLRHVLAHAAPGTRSVLSRAEIVLHGQQHWVRQTLGALTALALAAAGFVIALAIVGPGLQDHWTRGAYGMAIGLASMGFNPSFALPNMLWHSRREQALLRLLPGMPQGQALNRAVAGLQLRHALIDWAVTTAALGLLAWAAGDLALLCLAFGALPLSTGWLLRRPALMKAPTSWTAVVPVFAFLLMAGGLYVLHQKLGTPLVVLAGASLALSAALGVWRWRVLMAAPVALPTGRLA
ncbi:hypothetical protein [Roseateles sp.]|uniref:hypothetical protein n=1 Tax=Roseateles sp. TaxID=1971397 RepID=UPI003BAA60C0